MKKIISKISVLALAGVMMASTTGCGEKKETGLDVSEYPMTSIIETENETMPETEETEETTVVSETEETTEEIVTTTEYSIENEDWFLKGVGDDLRNHMDELYAVHLLVGEDAVKLYETGSYDNLASGYDLMWKFDDDTQYYVRDFSKNQNYTVDPVYDCSLKSTLDDVDQDIYRGLLYNKAISYTFADVTKADKYDPFANGDAEYKGNTVCIIYQKTEGSFENAEAFYYEIKQENHDNIIELFSNLETEDYDDLMFHKVTASDEIADMFKITSTGASSSDENVSDTTSSDESNEETTEVISETEQAEETKAE